MWLIKTKHGYLLEDRVGNILEWFDMACNCKAYCMEKDIHPSYINSKSSNADCQRYEDATGKGLWWRIFYD